VKVAPETGRTKPSTASASVTAKAGTATAVRPALRTVLPVRAAVAGTIETAGWNGGYGNYVRIAHGPIGTAYAHLQSYAPGLAPGTAVEAGDIIGYVGTTGRSTGPHLHFEVLVGDDAIDPMSVMPAQIQVALGGAPRIELARGGR